eukprot:INCI6264.1.p1 GENE.INCI6264.1~~INCI6264.1.p1  ORF type:complete len:335 (+),score=59.11 INCI6264.1:317-1321(+)
MSSATDDAESVAQTLLAVAAAAGAAAAAEAEPDSVQRQGYEGGAEPLLPATPIAAAPQTRYFCWDCKADVEVEESDSHELLCVVCGCSFIEVSDMDPDDVLSPEQFGETVRSTSNTPVSSPHLSPEAAVRSSLPTASGGSSASGTTRGERGDDVSTSLETTIQNLFQMLFSSSSALDGLSGSGRSGGGTAFDTFGDYAFGNLQDLIDTLSMNDQLGPKIGPASTELIASLPRTKVSAEQCTADDLAPCAICKDTLVEDGETEAVALRLPCKHAFHESCATMWLRQSSTCPVCRMNVAATAVKAAAVVGSGTDAEPATTAAVAPAAPGDRNEHRT